MSLRDIKGYDMVMAINQKTLNNQFQLMFSMNQLPTWDLNLADDGSKITAELGVPSIDLNVPVTRGAAIVIPIVSGSYTYYKIQFQNGQPVAVPAKQDLSGKSVRLVSSLKMLHKSDFHSSDFTIQQIFLDLSDPHMITNLDVELEGQALVALSTLLQQYLDNLHQQQYETFLFGSVKVPHLPDTLGPLAPTGADFSITIDASNPDNNCLNFLLLTDHHDSPNADPASGLFQYPLVSNGEAAFIVSDYKIISSFIVPTIVASMKVKDSGTNLKEENFDYAHNPCIVKLKDQFDFQGCRFTKWDIYFDNNEVRMDLEYRKSKDIGPAITITGIGNLSGFISIKVNNGELEYSSRQTDVQVSSDQGDLATRIILDILTLGFLEIGYKVVTDAVTGAISDLAKDNNLATTLNNAVHCIELPAKTLFVYDHLEMPKEQNMRLDVKITN
ncbi:hypothetical protein [Alicyclobacillus fodiniaquatilis]|uniref:Uncharacterized protein n=1 Tax=Alicyclobacillus fodiniaquatilis TaxID=1661150 RepID=A0ABW4JDQ3_9BACL